MAEKKFKSIGAALAAIKSDLAKQDKRVTEAARRAAERGAAHVRRNIPVAFSDLRDSVHAEGTKIIVDAPHAAVVELGSRPHRPPIEPLIKWVKLRGLQGQASAGQRARLPGTTSPDHASSFANTADSQARSVAFAIASAIAKRGTRPHWYMRNALPQILEFLREELDRVLK